MNARLPMLVLLSAVALPVAAQQVTDELKVIVSAQPEYVTARQLAVETGLSERQVRMVLGPHSGTAEYRLHFDRVQERFRDSVGEDRYQDLMAGRPIRLYRQGVDRQAGARTLVADVAGDEDRTSP